MKKKILVIGNYNDAIYHGLAGVDKRLTSILSDYELICTDDTSKLLSLEEDQISGIISYLDIWKSKLCDDLAEMLPAVAKAIISKKNIFLIYTLFRLLLAISP